MLVQGVRMAWANPYVKQAAASLFFEQVIPVVVSVTNERVAPVAKHTVNEKVIPAVKNAKSIAFAGLNNLKNNAVHEKSSKSSEVFVVTETQNENGTGRFVSVSRGLDEEFLQTWMPM